MEVVQYRDFARNIKQYLGKRVDIVGRNGLLGSLYPPELSDRVIPVDKANVGKCQTENLQSIDVLSDKLNCPIELRHQTVNGIEFYNEKIYGDVELGDDEYFNAEGGVSRKGTNCKKCGKFNSLVYYDNERNLICDLCLRKECVSEKQYKFLSSKLEKYGV